MFTKVANEITFSDIEAFCREFGEGVRVEYKQQIKSISKIVSSFANSFGGIFIIGAETDSMNQVVFPIQGIPKRSGIEEQIQQSALTGISPAVIPEVILCDVPANPNNVVVIVRVDESLQAPHAIENSTRVYIRVGSITQPYELKLAEVDQIEYMLKRREDSQITTRQILDRTEERIESLFSINEPNITAIARPVFPYRPIISTGNIYEFATGAGDLYWQSSSRVAGGWIASIKSNKAFTYWELNEYGIVYHREVLDKICQLSYEKPEWRSFSQFVQVIGNLIKRATSFYKECEYLGNVEITVQLRQIFDEKLLFYKTYHDNLDGHIKYDEIEKQRCLDSQVSVSLQRLPQDLVEKRKFTDAVDELTDPLLWAFNILVNTEGKRKLVERLLSRQMILDGFS